MRATFHKMQNFFGPPTPKMQQFLQTPGPNLKECLENLQFPANNSAWTILIFEPTIGLVLPSMQWYLETFLNLTAYNSAWGPPSTSQLATVLGDPRFQSKEVFGDSPIPSQQQNLELSHPWDFYSLWASTNSQHTTVFGDPTSQPTTGLGDLPRPPSMQQCLETRLPSMQQCLETWPPNMQWRLETRPPSMQCPQSAGSQPSPERPKQMAPTRSRNSAPLLSTMMIQRHPRAMTARPSTAITAAAIFTSVRRGRGSREYRM